MNELIEHIRAAVAQGATAQQKAVGAQACRTILTALEAEPGKPIAMPGVPAPHPLSKLSLDQVLDLLIARLSSVAQARDSQNTLAVPRGLRVPKAPDQAPRARPASAHDGRKR